MNPYSLLSRLPLFQGMSSSEFDDVISHVRMGFSKVSANERIFAEGEPVNGLSFILNGIVEMETVADDGSFSVIEEISTPCVIQPERLFGLTQRFSHNFSAKTDCQLLTISKGEVMRLTTESMVFRLNMMNLICTQAQTAMHLPWQHKHEDITKKITTFIRSHCLRPIGRKIVKIGMVQLGHEISESRLNVSKALHNMQEEGKITNSRGIIIIPHLEEL